MLIFDKNNAIFKEVQEYADTHGMDFDIRMVRKVNDEKYRIMCERRKEVFPGYNFAVCNYYPDTKFWSGVDYTVSEDGALNLMGDGKKDDKINEVKGYLYKAIIGWYDDNVEEYCGIDDEDFVHRVCRKTRMTGKEYVEVMGL